MPRQRTILVLLLALICGLSAVVGVSRIIGASRPPAEAAETVKVVVALQDLPPGDAVPATAVRTRAFPKDIAPAEAIADEADAAGRVALVPIAKDEPILRAKLADKGVAGGLAALIPVGKRAVCIRVNDVAAGMAGLIVPKNHVDVLFTANDQRADDPSGGGSTTTLLQDVEILAVDRDIYIAGDHKAETQELRSVTLLVTPDDAAKLDLAQNKGILHLSLRNPKDIDPVNPRVAQMLDLRGWQGKPEQVQKEGQAPAPTLMVERPLWIRILRGGASSAISVPIY